MKTKHSGANVSCRDCKLEIILDWQTWKLAKQSKWMKPSYVASFIKHELLKKSLNTTQSFRNSTSQEQESPGNASPIKGRSCSWGCICITELHKSLGQKIFKTGQNQATLTTNKQILSEWLENMGTLMVWNSIVGASSNDSCCSGTVTHDRVQNITNNWPKPSYSHHNTHLETSILFKRCNLMYKDKSRKNLQQIWEQVRTSRIHIY